uniref:Replication protein n=1 Tax=Rabbit circovirus 1 TaxID=2815203 RepID=A0A899IH49_9CIRC|nr:replication protein [Rabbit circovirus 1]
MTSLTHNACKQWIATLNNPTDEEREQVLSLEGEEVVVDEEVGEQSELPHLHIFLHLKKRARLSTLHKLLPRAHWEVAESRDMAVNYCSKGRVLRRQLLPKATKRALGAAVEVLRSAGIGAVAEQYPEVYVRHCRGLEALACKQQDRVAKPPP